MSLSRKDCTALGSAGWTVAEFGPWPALRAAVCSLIHRTARREWAR
jgi:hypothetical protein